jgi:hypothetical protein
MRRACLVSTVRDWSMIVARVAVREPQTPTNTFHYRRFSWINEFV